MFVPFNAHRTGLAVVMMAVWFSGCASPKQTGGSNPADMSKVKFDLTEIDPDGLRGLASGKVAVSYEFCIPDQATARAEVSRIDRTIQFHPGSRGRIGCRSGQVLCIGGTHQPGFRQVLAKLAALPYIVEIRECFFE